MPFSARIRPSFVAALKTRVNALMTRQSIFFVKIVAKMMDHPKSGLPDFGHSKCASRINPTCVVKPAGDIRRLDTGRLNFLVWGDCSPENLYMRGVRRSALAARQSGPVC